MLELAKEAWGENHEIFWFDDDGIERFAALVAAHEREACAKVCEDLYKHLNYDADCRKMWPHTKMMNDQYAAAIRARGKK